jgi:hypothetical protein
MSPAQQPARQAATAAMALTVIDLATRDQTRARLLAHARA